MEEKNVNNDLWDKIKNHLDELSILKSKILYNSETIKDLENAFKSVNETTYLLYFFKLFDNYKEIEIIQKFVPQLIKIALDGSPTNIQIARNVLSMIDKNWLLAQIYEPIHNELMINNDEWNYRRTAELLSYLDLPSILKLHLENCKAHSNIEIQEIAEDFT